MTTAISKLNTTQALSNKKKITTKITNILEVGAPMGVIPKYEISEFEICRIFYGSLARKNQVLPRNSIYPKH